MQNKNIFCHVSKDVAASDKNTLKLIIFFSFSFCYQKINKQLKQIVVLPQVLELWYYVAETSSSDLDGTCARAEGSMWVVADCTTTICIWRLMSDS